MIKNKIMAVMLVFVLIITSIPLTQSAKINPVISTLEAEDITEESSLLIGKISDYGDYTNVTAFFEYRIENNENWTETDKTPITTEDRFQERIKNLTSSTTYEYRFMADYNGETTTGSIRTLETEKSDNIFKFDLTDLGNIFLVILIFGIALLCMKIGHFPLSSIIVTSMGFIFLYNELNILISLIVIVIGIWIAFLGGENNGAD